MFSPPSITVRSFPAYVAGVPGQYGVRPGATGDWLAGVRRRRRRPPPSDVPRCSASPSASSTTIGPREVLTKYAEGFIKRVSLWGPIRPRVRSLKTR
ncbi:MAG: hypothetical protein Ct9H300mP13_7840 [Gammaproteobacteria bacterium]|nr:MAG: hypothetical protein Ct9H300mP13_7840 [Gammaproteobacteria bacterium]